MVTSMNPPESDPERLGYFAEMFDSPSSPEHLEQVRHALRNDSNDTIREWCPQLLRQWQDRSPETRAVLLECIRFGWYEPGAVLGEVFAAVAELGFADDEMVDAIAGRVADTGYMVSDNAAHALGCLQNPTPKVIAALEWALTCSDAYYADDFIRATAAWSLGELGQRHPSIVPGIENGLLRLAQDGVTSKEREAALEALSKCGLPAPS
jgi:hypothetical protein